MKKVAVTVAVLALGLAACAKNDANNMAANDMYTENAAETDMNVSMDATENAAGNALESASNAIDNAGNAVENAGQAVENAATNQ
jgi:outer membrane lipoprotein SlyB